MGEGKEVGPGVFHPLPAPPLPMVYLDTSDLLPVHTILGPQPVPSCSIYSVMDLSSVAPVTCQGANQGSRVTPAGQAFPDFPKASHLPESEFIPRRPAASLEAALQQKPHLQSTDSAENHGFLRSPPE